VKLLEAYEKLIEEQNILKAKQARKNNINYIASTVSENTPIYTEGSLTEYGDFVTRQLYQGVTSNQSYNEYVEKARKRGNQFVSLEQFEKNSSVVGDRSSDRDDVSRETFNKNVVNDSDNGGGVALFVVISLILIKMLLGVFK
jgi:hypothetical protein